MKNAKTLRCVLLIILVVGAFSGCASLSAGKDSKVRIEQTIDTLMAGIIAKDIDRIVSVYSDNMTPQEGMKIDKEMMRDLFQKAIDSGNLSDAKVDKSLMKITIQEDGLAAVADLILEAYTGDRVRINSTLREEGGIWRIIEQRIEPV